MLYFKKAGWSNSYSCAITRIPIFALGVAFAASRAKWLTTKNVIILGIIGLCLIYLYTLYCKNADFINLNAHYAMFFTTPVVIWCLTRILPVVHPKVRRAFAWLGTLSLQVYLVQIILMQRYFVGLINRTNIYVASFVMFAAILLISIAIDKAHKLIVKRIQGAK